MNNPNKTVIEIVDDMITKFDCGQKGIRVSQELFDRLQEAGLISFGNHPQSVIQCHLYRTRTPIVIDHDLKGLQFIPAQ